MNSSLDNPRNGRLSSGFYLVRVIEGNDAHGLTVRIDQLEERLDREGGLCPLWLIRCRANEALRQPLYVSIQ
jgi:hypothetical protein